MRTLNNKDLAELNGKIKWDEPEKDKQKAEMLESNLNVAKTQKELVHIQKETNQLLTHIVSKAIQNPQIEQLIKLLSQKKDKAKRLIINRDNRGLISSIDIKVSQ